MVLVHESGGKQMKNNAKVVRWSLAGVAAAATTAAFWFQDTAPFPYSQRWLLDVPLPFLTRTRLDAMLRPQEGERVLEVGPGTGLQSLHVAPQLGESGQLDIVDVQQPMLDHVAGRADEHGIGNIVPRLADGHDLPYADGTFDAAYLVTALGEIPDVPRTLRELRRVLKPEGRLVVGEFFDRHQVRLSTLASEAESAGMVLRRHIGPSFAYYGELRVIERHASPEPEVVAAQA